MRPVLRGAVLAGVVGCCGVGVAQATPLEEIRLEAEAATRVQGALRAVKKMGVSGGYLEASSTNSNFLERRATYAFKAKKAGWYTVWARVLHRDDAGNSFRVALNGGSWHVLGMDATHGVWHWVGGKARFEVRAGENTLVVSDLGHGLRLDRIVLTTDFGSVQGPKRKP